MCGRQLPIHNLKDPKKFTVHEHYKTKSKFEIDILKTNNKGVSLSERVGIINVKIQ